MYTISEAANRAGVTADVLRAWERRYQIVEPRRTSGGYRQYDEAAIRRDACDAAHGREEGSTPSTARNRCGTSRMPISRCRCAAGRFAVVRGCRRPTGPLRPERQPTWNRPPFRPSRREGARAFDRADDGPIPVPGAAHAGRRLAGSATVSVAAEHAASAAVGRWIGAAYDAVRHEPAKRAADPPVGLPAGARVTNSPLWRLRRRHGVPALRCNTSAPTSPPRTGFELRGRRWRGPP